MPNWVVFGLLAIAFTFLLAASQAGYWWWVSRQERQQEDLLRRISGGKMEDPQGGPETLMREQRSDAAANALGGLGAKIQQALLSSDSSTTVTQILVQMAVASAVGALCGFFAIGVIGLGGALPGGYLPYMLLQMRAASRTAKLVEQLPDALDLMSRAIQAGVGLSDAFRLAAEEMPPPVAIEFTRVFEEIRFGREFRDAFQGMIARNPAVFDLRLMVSSVLLQRETGGNLIEILDNISETIRGRFTFQQKVRAMTSEAKFTAMILGALPLFVLTTLAVLSPDYLNILFTDLRGNIILGLCAGSYLMGVTIMRDLSKVEV